MKAHDFRRLFRRIDRQQPWEDALWQSGRRSDERDQKAHALADRLADLDVCVLTGQGLRFISLSLARPLGVPPRPLLIP